ncbi:MAG: hypothetical protein UH854_05520 [Clostridia bacterium]|nr:hypothetical protein [Clostridia bacterium]
MNNKLSEFVKSKNKYVLFLILGVLFVVLSFGETGGNYDKDIEKKLKNTLEMAEGVGDVDVMLTFGEKKNVEGAIIVAEGAEFTSVKKVIHDSAVAVLGLPDYKVQVLIKKK